MSGSADNYNSVVLSMLEQFYYTADVAYAEPEDMLERWRELADEIFAFARARGRRPPPALLQADRLLRAGSYELGMVALHRIVRHPAVCAHVTW